MESLTLSLIIIFAAITVIPILSKKVNIPVIVLEIIFGIIIGKSLFDIIPAHPILDFFASFGLAYLMFLAGLEVDFEVGRKYLSRTVWVALFSISIPFLAGVLLAPYAGIHALLLGTIFSTTSLGLILPLTKELDVKAGFLHILFSSVILVDIISMFILAFSLAFIQGYLKTSFIYSSAAIFLLFIIPWLINRGNFQKKIEKWLSKKSHFEMEVRFSFALIFILAAISGYLGFHSIIGAFIAGLIISELQETSRSAFFKKKLVLEKKFESFGYGFFIPLFFVLIGAKVEIPILFSNLMNIKLLVLIIVVGIVAKVIGVSSIAKIIGFNPRESLSFGIFHSARLSLIIAAAEIASRSGLIDNNLFSIFVLLALVSAILSPSLGKFLIKKR
jgi:Kef-type K+ transport system membrane component KefB